MSALSRELGSRGRADAVSVPPDEPEPSRQAEVDAAPPQEHQALRTELAQLRPSVLKKRAKAAGATAEEIEEAEDADDPKTALISLIVSRQASELAGLASMKPSVLKKRARAAGASEAEIEEAEDGDDVKAALVALVLSNEKSASTKPSA